jgi:hypothetical protein
MSATSLSIRCCTRRGGTASNPQTCQTVHTRDGIYIAKHIHTWIQYTRYGIVAVQDSQATGGAEYIIPIYISPSVCRRPHVRVRLAVKQAKPLLIQSVGVDGWVRIRASCSYECYATQTLSLLLFSVSLWSCPRAYSLRSFPASNTRYADLVPFAVLGLSLIVSSRILPPFFSSKQHARKSAHSTYERAIATKQETEGRRARSQTRARLWLSQITFVIYEDASLIH